MVKNLPANVGDEGLIPGSGRTPGGGNGNFQARYSCLENLMDRGTWWATVHEVAKSNGTQLSTHAHRWAAVYLERKKQTQVNSGPALFNMTVMGWIVTPQNSYIEAQTLSSSECICIWRWRNEQVKMTLLGESWSNLTGVLLRRGHGDTQVTPGMCAHSGKAVWGHGKETAIYKQESPREKPSLATPDLGSPASRTVR